MAGTEEVEAVPEVFRIKCKQTSYNKSAKLMLIVLNFIEESRRSGRNTRL